MRIIMIISLLLIGLVISNPIVIGGDEDKIASKINELTTILNTKNIEELKSIAINIERYINSKRGGMVIGGLHDYLNSMTKDDLIHYSLHSSLNHMELLDNKKFMSVAEGEKTIFLGEKQKFTGKLGGLHDYIFRQDRETLIRWALTAEAHHKSKFSIPLIGGLHDKIQTMSNKDLAKYTLELARFYPELNSSEELEKLSQTYGIEENSVVKKNATLRDFIFTKDRDTLTKWAFTAEAHERKMKNHEGILGGLHDYIGKLSNQEIAEYILKKSEFYPELDNEFNLERLSHHYGIVQHEEKHQLHNLGNKSDTEISGTIQDFIHSESRDTLLNWALAIETYEREKNNIILEGGIHDFVEKLSNEEIIHFILNKANSFKELNDRKFLEDLCVKYGMNTRHN